MLYRILHILSQTFFESLPCFKRVETMCWIQPGGISSSRRSFPFTGSTCTILCSFCSVIPMTLRVVIGSKRTSVKMVRDIFGERGDQDAHPTNHDDTGPGPLRATVLQLRLAACSTVAHRFDPRPRQANRSLRPKSGGPGQRETVLPLPSGS